MDILTTEQNRVLRFHGSAQTLFGIWVVNVFLTLLTFGVYYFWAKVRIREYLLSQTSFEGDRFAYHGSGKELLIGWLKAMLCFGIPYVALTSGVVWIGADRWTVWAAGLLSWLILAIFPPLAGVWALRYRLSRMSWRGVRFAFRGHAAPYVKLVFKGTILTLLTLGLYYPFYATQKRAFLVSHTYFGTEHFTFDGRGKEFFQVCFKVIFLGIFVFGLGVFASGVWMIGRMWFIALLTLISLLALPWSYLQAEKQRFFWNYTAFRNGRCHSTVEFDSLLWLKLGNLLLLVCSLGLAWPWARVRNIQYTYQRHSLNGPLDLQGILQHSTEASATGDEVAGFFEVGVDLG